MGPKVGCPADSRQRLIVISLFGCVTGAPRMLTNFWPGVCSAGTGRPTTAIDGAPFIIRPM